jgi:hypothetical protein
MYDVIGDVHGHADALGRLLDEMGYRERGGVYRHASRRAVFVGDLIDRGPEIPRTLQIVRGMVEDGAALAVMGNHEYNALAFHTRRPGREDFAPDAWVRPHTPRRNAQYAETLRQFGGTFESVEPLEQCPPALREQLEWCRSLPLWLELEGCRVVHACWDPEQIAVLADGLRRYGAVNDAFLIEAGTQGTALEEAVEDVLKGKEITLPEDEPFFDHEENRRRKVRVQWFREPADDSFQTYALPGGTPERPYSVQPLPDAPDCTVRPYGRDEPPVFFGHYWLADERPRLLAHNVCCVDYSVARGGFLCAYRWDGERDLSEEKFVWGASG